MIRPVKCKIRPFHINFHSVPMRNEENHSSTWSLVFKIRVTLSSFPSALSPVREARGKWRDDNPWFLLKTDHSLGPEWRHSLNVHCQFHLRRRVWKGAIYSIPSLLCTLSIPHALSPALTDERVCWMERAPLPDTLADCYSASLENGD